MSVPSGWLLFREYEEEIKNKNRFFPNSKFLRLFDEITKEPYNTHIVKQGTKLYRARRNKPEGEFGKVSDLGVNKTNPANNRASPIGIPYMYLADEPETAIAEIRANVNERITVASFTAKEALHFVSLDGNTAMCSGNEDSEFNPFDILEFITYLGHYFALPIQRPEIEYLPTQYFAEYCKQKGFSGVRYVSSARGLHLGKNENHFNYVLFDANNVAFKDAYGYTVKNISYEITKDAQIYLKDECEK